MKYALSTLLPLLFVVGLTNQQLTHSAQISKAPLTFGMSTALSGPSADLGIAMRTGVLAAFARQNKEGGIAGKPMHLEVLDDGYEPVRTVPNIRQLLEDNVLGVVGNVGTPTAIAAIPLMKQAKVPFFGAFSGAGVLRRTPPEKYIVNYRASYAQETEAMVNALIQHAGLAPEEIAFFTQRDGYGDAGFQGGIQALKRHGLKDETTIAHGRYGRNTSIVEDGLADILSMPTTPKAVILVGTYAPTARFIQVSKQFGFEPLFLSVSFVGATSLAKALGPQGDGVIVTQIVPHISSDLSIIQDYTKDLKALDPDAKPDFGSLEGYIVGRILCRALKANAGQPASAEWVLTSLEKLGKFEMGIGTKLELSKTNHQACTKIWPTIISQGTVKPFSWADLSPSH